LRVNKLTRVALEDRILVLSHDAPSDHGAALNEQGRENAGGTIADGNRLSASSFV
jgi:hypothetical protein